ncbi:hypothetical protein, partial [Staphylococcus equorum]|uniref:hypothetical protein n=1 Tax=Staphylococcus equorum TaxID=246432 RepID=UPI0022AECA82
MIVINVVELELRIMSITVFHNTDMMRLSLLGASSATERDRYLKMTLFITGGLSSIIKRLA